MSLAANTKADGEAFPPGRIPADDSNAMKNAVLLFVSD
jgi:hypothetical protein